MKNKLIKRTLSLAMAVLVLVSLATVSISSASAYTPGETKYYFEFYTAGSQGTTYGDIMVKVNGSKGSTSFHNIGMVGSDQNMHTASFTDVDVDVMESITVYVVSSVDDGWYPNGIYVSTAFDSMVIYGGRWVDDGQQVTIKETDNVLKLDINTCDDTYAGTDGDVKMRFTDTDGTTTKDYVNLTSIHPKSNAFERDDYATFYVYVPDNFGTLRTLTVFSGGDGIYSFGADWKLDDIAITQLTGSNAGAYYYKSINQWMEDGHGEYKFYF